MFKVQRILFLFFVLLDRWLIWGLRYLLLSPGIILGSRYISVNLEYCTRWYHYHKRETPSLAVIVFLYQLGLIKCPKTTCS